jgi:hypothetical protein
MPPPPLLPTRRKKKRFDVRDRDPHHYMAMFVYQLMEAGGCWSGSAVSVGMMVIETTVSSVLNSEMGASIFQLDSRC